MLRFRSVRTVVSRRSLHFATVLVLFLAPACVSAQSQDPAEAARQEKARKAAAAKDEKKDTHVYTNEDLQRSQILTPEDHGRVAARKKDQSIPPGSQPTDTLDAAAAKTSESLGEVARRYRREKAARDAEQALKTSQPLRLPTELSQPALATPRPLRVQPVVPIRPAKPRVPSIAPPSKRRDPFWRPTISISPALPSHTDHANSAVPTIASTPRNPAKAATVAPPEAARAPFKIEPRFTSRPSTIRPALRIQPGTLTPSSGTSTITIQPDDSLWRIARRHLGRGSRWHDLAAVNPTITSTDHLQPGTSLVMPPGSSRPPSLTSSPTRRVSVQKGDSLWRIAQAQFGNGARWSCLAQANPQIHEVDRIYPGQALILPATCAATP